MNVLKGFQEFFKICTVQETIPENLTKIHIRRKAMGKETA